MSRAPTYIALVLTFLAIPQIPWVFVSASAMAAESNIGDSFASAIWTHNVIAIAGFLAAAALAAFRVRFWPIATVAICGYIALIATPAFLRMGLREGFFTNFQAVYRHAIRVGFADGFYSFWNLVVLPTVPAIMVVLVPVIWWLSRPHKHAAESNP